MYDNLLVQHVFEQNYLKCIFCERQRTKIVICFFWLKDFRSRQTYEVRHSLAKKPYLFSSYLCLTLLCDFFEYDYKLLVRDALLELSRLK